MIINIIHTLLILVCDSSERTEMKLVHVYRSERGVLVACLVRLMLWWDMLKNNISIADGYTVFFLVPLMNVVDHIHRGWVRLFFFSIYASIASWKTEEPGCSSHSFSLLLKKINSVMTCWIWSKNRVQQITSRCLPCGK